MFELTIPGDPAPWTVFTKNRAPTPGFYAMKAWQEQVRFYLQAAWQETPVSGPVTLDTEFFLRWPQLAPQRDSKAMDRWYWKHLAMKPDLDNLRKAFSDCLEGILLYGDQQITAGKISKDILRPTKFVNCGEGYTQMRFYET